MSNALKFRTITNGVHKVATDNFGVEFHVQRVVFGGKASESWVAYMVDSGQKTYDNLIRRASYQQAINACNTAAGKRF